MSGVAFNPYAALNAAKSAASQKAEGPGAAGAVVTEGLADFRVALQEAETAATQTAIAGADPHAMIAAFANAEMMLDTVVTIRDKVVEAYQELLRMPV